MRQPILWLKSWKQRIGAWAASILRKSRPFVDLLVVQVEEGGSATNPATMRVFDVSDDVYQSLREGVGLRLKGVAVKDNRKNSLVQLLKTQSSCMKVLKLDAEALAER